jgi:hypothetical protein
MTEMDVAILLAPSFMFAIIGLVALIEAGMIQRLIDLGDSQQKFDTFTKNVQSGKWQLTTDRWLEVIHHDQVLAVDNFKARQNFHELMLELACAALAGIVCQIVAI